MGSSLSGLSLALQMPAGIRYCVDVVKDSVGMVEGLVDSASTCGLYGC